MFQISTSLLDTWKGARRGFVDLWSYYSSASFKTAVFLYNSTKFLASFLLRASLFLFLMTSAGTSTLSLDPSSEVRSLSHSFFVWILIPYFIILEFTILARMHSITNLKFTFFTYLPWQSKQLNQSAIRVIWCQDTGTPLGPRIWEEEEKSSWSLLSFWKIYIFQKLISSPTWNTLDSCQTSYFLDGSAGCGKMWLVIRGWGPIIQVRGMIQIVLFVLDSCQKLHTFKDGSAGCGKMWSVFPSIQIRVWYNN